jgi:hypothetical protein
MAGRHRRPGLIVRVVSTLAFTVLSLLAFGGSSLAETDNDNDRTVECGPVQLSCSDSLVSVGPLIGGPIADTGEISFTVPDADFNFNFGDTP